MKNEGPNEELKEGEIMYNPTDYIPGFRTIGKVGWLDDPVPEESVQFKFWQELSKLAEKYKVISVSADFIKRW